MGRIGDREAFSNLGLVNACRQSNREEMLSGLAPPHGFLWKYARRLCVTYINWGQTYIPMDDDLASALRESFPNLEIVNLVGTEVVEEEKSRAKGKWGFEIE